MGFRKRLDKLEGVLADVARDAKRTDSRVDALLKSLELHGKNVDFLLDGYFTGKSMFEDAVATTGGLIKRVGKLEAAQSDERDVLNEVFSEISKLTARVTELEKKLAELEPELERYKQDAEEAAEYEKRRNDGMEAIFGYMTPGMRGGENG